MKMVGQVCGHEVLVLIDCGAFHNFLNSSIVERLGVQISQTKPYYVTFGDGHKVKGSGICKGVEENLQGLKITQDFYLFDLGGADMVLGYEWLGSLGKTTINWHQHTKNISGEEDILLERRPSAIQGHGFIRIPD